MEKHEVPGLLQTLSPYASPQKSGMPLVDALDNARGANKAAENVTLVFMTEGHCRWSMPKHFA
jgi:hypothetical protein